MRRINTASVKKALAIALCLLQLFLVSACISSDDLDRAYARGYSEGYEDGYSDGLRQSSAPASSRSYSDYASSPSSSADYILNTSTKKFHYPSCSTVGQMKEENKQYFSGSRSEIIAMGYDPCGRCKP